MKYSLAYHFRYNIYFRFWFSSLVSSGFASYDIPPFKNIHNRLQQHFLKSIPFSLLLISRVYHVAKLIKCPIKLLTNFLNMLTFSCQKYLQATLTSQVTLRVNEKSSNSEIFLIVYSIFLLAVVASERGWCQVKHSYNMIPCCGSWHVISHVKWCFPGLEWHVKSMNSFAYWIYFVHLV